MSKLIRSFGFAISGIMDALAKERNFRFQWLCGFLTFLVTNVVGFADWQTAIVLILVILTLALELFNCAIEKACDSSGLDFCFEKKLAKDYSAGGVLLVAMASALVFYSFLSSNSVALLASIEENPMIWLSLCFIAFFHILMAINSSINAWYLLLVASMVGHGFVIVIHHDHLWLTALALIFHGLLVATYVNRALFPIKPGQQVT